jgi:hypothetical protein
LLEEPNFSIKRGKWFFPKFFAPFAVWLFLFTILLGAWKIELIGMAQFMGVFKLLWKTGRLKEEKNQF